MELSEEVAEGVTIIAVVGRLDGAATRQFDARLTELIDGGSTRLLIDMSRLNYIGSLGLRALFVASRRAVEEQGRFALHSLTAPIHHVMELGGFVGVFEQYVSREEALAAMLGG
jgi:anti-sigma B factor antagonist